MNKKIHIFAIKKMTNIESSYLGLKLKSPIIIASSGLTNSIEKIISFEKHGAGAIVLKSLFEEQIRFEYNKGIQSTGDGFHYPEAEDYIRQYTTAKEISDYVNLIKKAKQSVSIPIIASINCTSSDNWTSFAKDIELAGADAIELNIYILSTDKTKDSLSIETRYYDIIRSVRNNTKLPISVKIANNFTNLPQFIDKLSYIDIQGIVLFNRLFKTDIDLEKMRIVSGDVFSQSSDLYESLRWIAIISGNTRVDLCASGGIQNGASVLKSLAAGAKSVQIASVFYKQGIEILDKIHEDMLSWLDTHNYKSVSELIGKMSYKQTEHPAALERVQFMKYFSGIE